MRIVGGYLRGKRIEFLKSITTRPLRDFVKENIFNIINHSNLIKINLKNANVLDVYSGVGSFGIECISQGAKMSTFVENNSQALSVLKKNLDNLKIVDNSEIYSEKTTTLFKKARNKDKFEVIFLDPPFVENFFIEELEMIKKSFIYKKEHLIVVHREVKSKDKLDDVLNVFLTRSYGRSKILFGNF